MLSTQKLDGMLDKIFVQRDSQREFKIKHMSGYNVTLEAVEKPKHTCTIWRSTLVHSLNSENGSWHLKAECCGRCQGPNDECGPDQYVIPKF